MATKKKRKSEELKAKKKKKGFRLFFLVLLAAAVLGFLAFLGITFYDFIYPPAEKDLPESKKEKIQVVLYFADADERFLVPEKRWILKDKSPSSQAEKLVQALIDGPGEGAKKGLVRVFPDGTVLRSVRIDKDATATVDFDKTLVERHPGGSSSEIATVYALTNTLTQNLPAVKKVQILVDGKVRETLKGHMDTRYPFVFNKDLIKEPTQ